MNSQIMFTLCILFVLFSEHLGENEVLDCAINVILVHKNGVYIATELGQIICLDVTPSAPTAVKGHLAEDKSPTVLATNAKLVSHLYTNQSILSGYFSLYYDKIVFRTKNVRKYVFFLLMIFIDVIREISGSNMWFEKSISLIQLEIDFISCSVVILNSYKCL